MHTRFTYRFPKDRDERITLTEENAMAALANIGFKSIPLKGKRIPAAIGIPMRL
jgi:hypothetical protein